MDTTELSARITLRAMQATDLAINTLVDAHGTAREVLRYPQLWADPKRKIKSPTDNSVRARVLHAMRVIDADGIHVFAADAPDYPRRLTLRLGDTRPALLFARGDIRIVENAAVAIVGSRNMSEYGRAVADDFGRLLARAGYTILSGLALGVDAVAHEAALHEEADTIAIVGNGIDVTYPPANARLRQRIIQEGLLLSQFLPGQRPMRHHFAERNRILAALAEGVLVVEAGARSGAIITAHQAADCGVDAMAIPGPIGHAQSRGTNQLIREGVACVTSASEVMEMLDGPGRNVQLLEQRWLSENKRLAQASLEPAASPRTEWVSEETRSVRKALEASVLHLDEIVEITGLAISGVVTALLELEMNGQVRQHPGSRYELRRAQAH